MKIPGLVLTRRVGQTISIEHGLVEIEVIRIQKGQVRLRIKGNVRVDRKEVLERDDSHEIQEISAEI